MTKEQNRIDGLEGDRGAFSQRSVGGAGPPNQRRVGLCACMCVCVSKPQTGGSELAVGSSKECGVQDWSQTIANAYSTRVQSSELESKAPHLAEGVRKADRPGGHGGEHGVQDGGDLHQ